MLVTFSPIFFFAVSIGNITSKMSVNCRLDRKIGFQKTLYTKCTNFTIDGIIVPSIILRCFYSLHSFFFSEMLRANVYITIANRNFTEEMRNRSSLDFASISQPLCSEVKKIYMFYHFNDALLIKKKRFDIISS